MKKISLLMSILFLFSLFSVTAQSREDWDAIVDFDITLEDLSDAAGDMDRLSQMAEKIVVIRGTVGSRQVLNADRETYQAELKLVAGEWQGLEEVKMYSALVVLSGPEFSNYVPARRSRNPHPDEVAVNSNVLVICRLVGVTERNGENLPVLETYHLRELN